VWKRINDEITYFRYIEVCIISEVFQRAIKFVRGQFACERDDVEKFQQPKSGAGLGCVDCRWEPLASEELLTVGYPSLASTEIDGYIVNPIGVKDYEVLVPRLGSNALAAKMVEAHTQTH
jgi:hypothetical protein